MHYGGSEPNKNQLEERINMGEEYIIKKTLKQKKIWFDSPRLALIEQLVAK